MRLVVAIAIALFAYGAVASLRRVVAEARQKLARNSQSDRLVGKVKSAPVHGASNG